jgi:4-amino-4-deoxy-L-arabinose transferase-like glycosyltransferase
MLNVVASQSKSAWLSREPWRFLGSPWIYWVLAAALFVRFAVCLLSRPDPTIFADAELTPRYVRLAQNLVGSGRFTEAPTPHASSPAELPPGFPLFLAVQWFLIGESTPGQLLVQAILGMLTCGLIFAIADGMLGRFGALFAGMCAAVDPAFVLHSLYLTHEGLRLFFLALAAWAILLALRYDYRLAWMLGGLAAGLAALTWHDALWIVALLALGFIWLYRSRPRVGLQRALWFGGLFLVAIGPWVGRNVLISGRIVYATDAGRRRLEDVAAAVPMMREGLSREKAIQSLREKAFSGHVVEQLSGIERSRLEKAQAFRTLAGHPLVVARVLARGVVRSLTAAETHVPRRLLDILLPVRGSRPLALSFYAVLCVGLQWLLLALIAVGAWQHKSWRLGWVWWGPILYAVYFLPFMASLDAGAGLRVAAAPALYLLAAQEIGRYWPWVLRRQKYRPERFGRVAHQEGAIIVESEEGGLTP